MERPEYKNLKAKIRSNQIQISAVFDRIKFYGYCGNSTAILELITLIRMDFEKNERKSLLEFIDPEMISILKNWLEIRTVVGQTWQWIQRVGMSLERFNSLSKPHEKYANFLAFYYSLELDFPYPETVKLLHQGIEHDWIQGENCKSCDTKYHILRWKHHCRNCGNIVCDRCSFNRLKLVHFGFFEPVRVCNGCYQKVIFVGRCSTRGTQTDSSKIVLPLDTRMLSVKEMSFPLVPVS
jgi:hypothetical protein